MPLTKLQVRPGIVRDTTSYANEGGWYYSDKVRFRSGSPEKIGGWVRASTDTYLGSCTALMPWASLAGLAYCAVGTNLKYYVESGTLYDITPIRSTTGTGDARFTATNGSTTVLVTDTAHGASTGDYVTFTSAVTLGGVVTAAVLNAEFSITYLTANTYNITIGAAANGADVGDGGAATIAKYQIPVGLATYTVGVGWGAGTWPSYATTTLGADPFTTTFPGTPTVVTVTHAAHGLTTGDYVYFASISVGSFRGITSAKLIRAFQITTAGAGAYTFVSPDAATSAGTGGGTVVVYTPTGTSRAWSTPATVGVGQQLRLWSQGAFGEDLVFCDRNAAIYYWDTSAGTSTRAVALTAVGGASDVPTVATAVIVTDSRHVVALGCNPLGSSTQDPLLVRWTDTESAVNWTPTATNTSGGQRLTIGTKIMAARNTRLETLIWTDAALYSMTFIGGTLEFGFNFLGTPVSLVGPNAMGIVGGTAYWMGTDKFYIYNGTVQTLPCPLIRVLLDNINHDQVFQIFAGTNELFTEVTWFYCSTGSTVVDSYVTFNYGENVWYIGTLGRTAWVDSGIRTFPMAADRTTNTLVYHEVGNDNASTSTPTAISAYIESSDIDLGDGHQFMFISRVIPDVSFQGSDVSSPAGTLTIKTRNTPGNTWITSTNEPSASTITQTADNGILVSPIEEFTPQVWCRLRGRQAALRFESSMLGVKWQLGAMRLDIRPDGRR